MQQKHGVHHLLHYLCPLMGQGFVQILAAKIAQNGKKKLQDGFKPGCPLPF